MTLSSTRPTRADPPPAPSTSSIDFELEQLLKELRECRDEGPKSSADPAITLGDGSTASGTPAARDDGDEEYEAVQRAAMEVLERGRRQARLEELEDRIRCRSHRRARDLSHSRPIEGWHPPSALTT